MSSRCFFFALDISYWHEIHCSNNNCNMCDGFAPESNNTISTVLIQVDENVGNRESERKEKLD